VYYSGDGFSKKEITTQDTKGTVTKSTKKKYPPYVLCVKKIFHYRVLVAR